MMTDSLKSNLSEELGAAIAQKGESWRRAKQRNQVEFYQACVSDVLSHTKMHLDFWLAYRRDHDFNVNQKNYSQYQALSLAYVSNYVKLSAKTYQTNQKRVAYISIQSCNNWFFLWDDAKVSTTTELDSTAVLNDSFNGCKDGFYLYKADTGALDPREKVNSIEEALAQGKYSFVDGENIYLCYIEENANSNANTNVQTDLTSDVKNKMLEALKTHCDDFLVNFFYQLHPEYATNF